MSSAESEEKENWPKTLGGTTDWELVFESRQIGFIPKLEATTSARDLRHLTAVTIQRLFTRQGDEMQIEKFMEDLAKIIPDDAGEDALPAAKGAVIKILREMKELRIAKAAEFEAEQLQKAALKTKVDDMRRRRCADDQKTQEFFYAVLGLAAACIVGVVVLSITAIDFGGGSAEDETANHTRFVEQMLGLVEAEEGREPGSRGKHIYGGELKTSLIAEQRAFVATDLPPAACAATSWSLSQKGLVVINGFAPKRVGPTTLSRLCHDVPGGARLVWVPKDQPGSE